MMKDKTASRIRSIVAHVVLIILSFMCLFFLLCTDRECVSFSCRASEGIFCSSWKIFLKNLMNVAK